MHKRCREIMDELILSGELEEINWFEFAPKEELKLRLKDMLDDEVDEKYLLNQTNINFMNTIWGNNTRWRKMKNPIDGCAGTICATHSKGLPRGVIINDKDIQEQIYKEGTIKLEQVATLNIKGNDSIKRIYSDNGLCPSLTTMQGGHREPKVAIEDKYTFRKLTPRECFRLQGFDDSFIFPPKMSDTQLYKQAGNGMSRNILDMIFTQIFTCYAKHIEKQN